MSPRIIVADAGALIALAKLDQLSLLPKLFSAIHVPESVYRELTVDNSRTDVVLLNDFLTNSVEQCTDTENAFTLSWSLCWMPVRYKH